MDAHALLTLFIYIIIAACAFGVALFIVHILPIPEPYKGWLRIAILVLGALIVLIWLVSMLGSAPIPSLRR